MQSSIESELENHDCFSTKRESQPNDQTSMKNEVCFHSEVGLVVINDSITILDTHSIKYVTLDPQLTIHPMYGGTFNVSGNMLAIQGKNQILVIMITEEIRSSVSQGGKIRCGSKVITLGPIHNHSLVKIAWHPLSDSHLVVLTDELLRLYNCTSQTVEPEQKINLTGNPSSFAFGGSSYLDSWQRFTIYILMQTGDIYAICPLIPFDCMIPVEYITLLQEKSREREDDYACKWLKEIKGPSIKLDFGSPVGIKRVNKKTNYRSRSSTPTKRSFSVHFDSDEDSEDEEDDEPEKGMIRTKKPQGFDYQPELQGPLAEKTKMTAKYEFISSSDILFIPTTPTVIVRAYADAFIEVYLLFEDIPPKFVQENLFRKQKDNNQLILYENIDLGLPTYNKDMGKCRLTNALAVSSNEFYAHHGAGIHRIKLHYLTFIAESMLNNDTSRFEKETIPSSEMFWLLNTLPLGSIQGCRPVIFIGFTLAILQGKLYIVAKDSEGQCHCVSDSVLQTKRSIDVSKEDSSKTYIQNMNLQFPKKVTKVNNLQFEKDSQAMSFLLNQTDEQAKNQFATLIKIDALLKEQLRSINDTYLEQQAELEEAFKKKEKIQKNEVRLKQTISEIQKAQELIVERTNRALYETMSLQKHLTKAEIKFHEELISLKKQTNNQELEVNELSKALDSLQIRDSNEKQIVKPKEANLDKILGILEQEGNLLVDIQKQTKGLEFEVQKLYGLSVL